MAVIVFWVLEVIALLIVVLDPLITLTAGAWILIIFFAVIGPPFMMEIDNNESEFRLPFCTFLYIIGLVLTCVVLFLPYLAVRFFVGT